MDLVELLKRPEGKTLEFKHELSAPEGALRTIVASTNTVGRTLLVGVEDKSSHLRGIRRDRRTRSGATTGLNEGTRNDNGEAESSALRGR